MPLLSVFLRVKLMLKNEMMIADYRQLFKSAVNAKVNTGDSTFSNSIDIDLTADKLLVWLNEPSQAILNVDFKNLIEQIASSVLYPAFVIKHKAGLTLIPRINEPPESARALSFDLHLGIYKRLRVSNLNETNLFQRNEDLAIALMQDYYWIPSTAPHLAIQAITRGGKTTFLRFLEINCSVLSKIAVKNGAIDDGAPNLMVIDPKLDASLRLTTLALSGDYVSPDFSKSDNNFLDVVCEKLKGIVDIMRYRAKRKKESPNIKFKDIFLFIDEAISIPNFASNSKNRNIYFNLIDKILLMGASFKIHVVASSQSFLSGSQGAMSSQARLEFGAKILLASRITSENAQFLFKDLDKDAIDNLILDEDEYGTLGVGIVTNGDGNIVPFKAPYIGDFNEDTR